MHYLGLALYAEGPTDYYFLQPLLRRLCEDVVVTQGKGATEVSEVLGINHPDEATHQGRGERILAAGNQAKGSWNVLFVHADGAGDAEKSRREQVLPGIAAIQPSQGVPVVPVRETEAWALVDGNALRQAFGCTLSDHELGLPIRAKEVERVADPKLVLGEALSASHQSYRRRGQSTSQYLGSLGEQTNLSKLRELPSFNRLEADLVQALKNLGVLQ